MREAVRKMTGRVAADFVAGMVNHAADGHGTEQAAMEAAEAVRGPGADEIRAMFGRRRDPARSNVGSGLEELAERWGSGVLATAAIAVRTGGMGRSMGPFLLKRAEQEAAMPSVRQVVAAQFVASFLDALAVDANQQMALEAAALPLRGPGAGELAEAVNSRPVSLARSAQNLAELAQRWDSPLLDALVTTLQAGRLHGPATHGFLLAGVQAAWIPHHGPVPPPPRPDTT